jgi:outer membrane protein assembly factor BamB
MKRFSVARICAVAACLGLILSGCSSTPTTGREPAELEPIEVTSAAAIAWESSIGDAQGFTFTPSFTGEAIFVAERGGDVARLDQNGKPVWEVSLDSDLSGGVGSDGQRVVVGTTKGEIITLNASDGKQLWRGQLSSEVLAVPVVSGSLIVARSSDSRIGAFDATTGIRRWWYQRTTPPLVLRSDVGITIDGNATLVGFPGGKLAAINNQNGSLLWEGTVSTPKGATDLERITDITSRPAVSGGIACSATFKGRVACFDRVNGNQLWARDISSSAGMDIGPKNVYVADSNGTVHALDRSSGASLWSQNKLAYRQLSRPLLIGNELFVADYEGYVHILRISDGAFVGRLKTDGSPVRAEIVRTATGALVQTSDGGLFAINAK